MLSLTPCAALADARADVLSGIARCDRIADDRAWLECVEAAAQPMRAKLALPAAPPGRPSPAQASASAAGSKLFGLRLPAPPPPPAAGIHERLTAYQFDRFGMFTVTLANGQVWRQIAGDTSVAHWVKPASAYTANIRNGAMGSFNLRLDEENGGFKVLRIR
jgi:hypothetical protein